MTHMKSNDGAITKYRYRLIRQLSTQEMAAVKALDRSIIEVVSIQKGSCKPLLQVKVNGNDSNSDASSRIASQLRQWGARA